MSDDLSINQQQYSNNAIPGLLTGAAIGGAGGAYAASQGYGIGRKVSAEKILNQKPDVFVRMIDNGGKNREAWQIARDYAKKISDKGIEYDNKLKFINEKMLPALENYRTVLFAALEMEQKNSPEYIMLAKELEQAKDKRNSEVVKNIETKLEEENTKLIKQVKKNLIDSDIRKNYVELCKEAKNEFNITVPERGERLAVEAKEWLNSLGTKDDYVNVVKDEAITKIKTLLDNLKLPSKTWTGVVAGALLATAGCAIGATISSNEES